MNTKSEYPVEYIDIDQTAQMHRLTRPLLADYGIKVIPPRRALKHFSNFGFGFYYTRQQKHWNPIQTIITFMLFFAEIDKISDLRVY